MKVKDIIKDDKFNEFLGYEIEAYNNRPAPQEGCRYRRTPYDALKDAKKSFRQQPEEGVGAFRYYCSPEGLITEVDLPDKWGLLWEKDGVITVVKDAERQQQNAQGEITILASIMRREGVKPRLFDYRKQNNEYEAERRN